MFHPPPGPNDEPRFSEKPIPVPKAPGKSESNPDGIAPDCPQGDDLYQYVNECLDNGSAKNEVLKQLIAYGYTHDEAETIVDDAGRWRYKNQYAGQHVDIGTTNQGDGGSHVGMWIGAAICILGIVITVGSCMAAGERGGSYTVAYGAIIWGAIMFFRGLTQSNRS